MKTLLSVLLAFALALPVLSLAQSNSSQNDNQATTQASQASQNQGDKSMTGKVSSDGKTFTNDKDNKTYTVNNPDALQGHEGQRVALVVHVDPDNNVIHISQIELPPQQ